MGLDICRFIEVKRNNKWERLIWGETSHFNNGKNILEWWLSTTNLCKNGIPEDSDSKEIYKNWGYSFQWVTLDKIVETLDEFEHNLHLRLKLKTYDEMLDKILGKTKDSDSFYPTYPWNDYTIENEFDDEYACGILKFSCLRDDLYTAKGIVEASVKDGDMILDENIRIIFVYNN